MHLNVLSYRLTRIAGELVSAAICGLTGRVHLLRGGALALGLGAAAFSANALSILIVNTGAYSDTATNLSTRQTSAGNTTTMLGVGALPTSLSTYDQVWDLGYNQALSTGYVSTLTNYLQGGGTLFLMGENPGAAPTRNPAITSFLTGLGAGTVSIGGYGPGAETVASQFQVANHTSTVTFAGSGVFSAVGHGTCITSACTAAAWGVGSLSNAATGTVISVLDVNFLNANYFNVPFTDNLIAYLAQQQQVGSGNPPAPTSSDIDTSAGSYAASNLGNAVNPAFKGGTLDIDAAQMTLSQNFTVSGAGGTLQANGTSATLSGVIADEVAGTPGALHITGTGGTITLSGINTYTGATTVAAGATLALSGNGSIAASSGAAVDGTLDLAGAIGGTALKTLTGSGQVALGSNTLTLSGAVGNFAGVIAGAGGLEIAGGTQTLSNANLYTGLTQIDNGATLALTGAGSIAASSGVVVNGALDVSGVSGVAALKTVSGNGTIALGAQTLRLDAASGSFGGAIGGTGGLNVAGGQLALTGSNGYTGTTTIGNGATLALTGAGSIAASSGVVVNGVLNVSGVSGVAALKTVSGNGTIALGAQTLRLDAASGSFGGAIGGTGGLNVAGGQLALTGSNGYTGTTTIGSGATLALTGAGSIAASSGVVVNGALDVSGVSGVAALKTVSGNGTIALGAQTLRLDAASGSFGGSIGGTGGLNVVGGQLALTGSNGYTGTTTIGNGATLALTGAGSIAASSGVVVNGSLNVSGVSGVAALKTVSGSGTIALGAQTLRLDAASGSFGGAIGGTGGLNVAGGQLALTGSSGYTGATMIGSGATLALTGAGSIAASSGVVVNGSLNVSGVSGVAALKTVSGSGTIALGTQTLRLDAASGSFGGAIGGTGGLTLAGGQLTLSNVNAYTGATTIGSGATLALTGGGNLVASSGVGVNGTLDLSGVAGVAALKTVSGNGAITLGGQTLRLEGASGSFGGAIGGTGGLNVAGGQLALTNASSYTGATTIGGTSTLALTGAGSIAASSGVAVNGTLDVSGAANGVALKTLSGNGTVALGSQTLRLDAASGGFGGAIGGTGGLTVAGGQLALTGSNGYTGATTIGSGATLALTGGGGIAASSGVANAGTLDISGATNNSTVAALSGAGQVVLGARTLTVNNASAFTGSLSGTGGLTVTGGSLTFTGTQAGYTGLTTIGNTALVSANGRLAGGVAVQSGGTLHGSGVIAGPVTVAAGGKFSPGNSPGVLTVNSTVSLAAGAIFDAEINGNTAGNGAGHYDQLNLVGSTARFNANGATLTVNLKAISGLGSYTAYVPQLGDSFRIVTAEGGIGSTRFAPITQPDGLAAGLRLRVVYGAGGASAIDLRVVPVSFSAYGTGRGLNRNATSVANAVDTMLGADDAGTATAAQRQLGTTVSGLTPAQFDAAMVGLSGEIHGAMAAAQSLSGQGVQNAVANHLSMAGASRLWVDYGTGDSRTTADDVASATRNSRNQFTLGVDLLQGASGRLGAAVAQSTTQVAATGEGSGKLEDNLVVLYGQQGWSGWTVDAQVGHGTGHSRTYRANPLAAQDALVYGGALSTDLGTSQTFAGLGVRAPAYRLSGVTLEPFARLGAQRVRRDAGSEGGAGSATPSALSLAALSLRGTRVAAGVTVTSAASDPMVASHTFRGSVAVGRDRGSLLHPVVGATLAGIATSIEAPQVGRGFVQGNLTGTWLLTRSAYLYAGISGEARSQRVEKALNAGMTIAF